MASRFSSSSGEQADAFAEAVAPAQHSLPAFGDVLVLVERWIVTKKHELVGLPAVGDGCVHLRAELLLQKARPAFGVFERRIVTVELVCAKGPVASGQQDIGRSQRGVQPTLRAQLLTAIVAIRDEAGREVAATASTSLHRLPTPDATRTVC